MLSNAEQISAVNIQENDVSGHQSVTHLARVSVKVRQIIRDGSVLCRDLGVIGRMYENFLDPLSPGNLDARQLLRSADVGGAADGLHPRGVDIVTATHSIDVADIADRLFPEYIIRLIEQRTDLGKLLAATGTLDLEYIRQMYYLGNVTHDVGKQIPPIAGLIQSDRRFTPAEKVLVDSHAAAGSQLLKGAEFRDENLKSMCITIAAKHHTSCSTTAESLADHLVKLTHVVDIIEACRSMLRMYKEGWAYDKIESLILELRDKRILDPIAVDVCIGALYNLRVQQHTAEIVPLIEGGVLMKESPPSGFIQH